MSITRIKGMTEGVRATEEGGATGTAGAAVVKEGTEDSKYRHVLWRRADRQRIFDIVDNYHNTPEREDGGLVICYNLKEQNTERRRRDASAKSPKGAVPSPL